MPDLDETLGWIGFRVNDVYGARVGRVEDIYVDSDRGAPQWIFTKLGRFSDDHALIPISEAVVGGGHVWVPYEKELIRGLTVVGVGSPISMESEMALCEHFGLTARGTALAGMAPTAVTAISAGAARIGLPPLDRSERRAAT